MIIVDAPEEAGNTARLRLLRAAARALHLARQLCDDFDGLDVLRRRAVFWGTMIAARDHLLAAQRLNAAKDLGEMLAEEAELRTLGDLFSQLDSHISQRPHPAPRLAPTEN